MLALVKEGQLYANTHKDLERKHLKLVLHNLLIFYI